MATRPSSRGRRIEGLIAPRQDHGRRGATFPGVVWEPQRDVQRQAALGGGDGRQFPDATAAPLGPPLSRSMRHCSGGTSLMTLCTSTMLAIARPPIAVMTVPA